MNQVKKAIGYIRYSDDEQGDGNSIERQEGNIRRYCSNANNGLKLIDILIDDGYSASKGEHLSHGKLGPFLKQAEQGKFVDCALVVEEMDRLSRLGIKKTRVLLDRIVDAGVEMHITQTNRVIKNEEDVVTELINVLESHGAKEYSRKLAERIVNSWIGKRANMLAIDEETKKVVQVTPLTSLLPKWLKIEGRIVRNGKVINAGKIVEVPGIVAIVHEIFRLAALGLGAKKIRQSLNGQGDAVTMAWITYTLQNEQVLGKFQHHHYENGKRVPYGEPVFDYYPRIISDEEWRFARAEIDRKNSVDTATRKMTHGARNSDRAENLFSGLIFDATTEPVRTLIFQRQRNKKGSLQNPFLVTSTAIEGPSHRLRYDRFEKAFLYFLKHLDWKAVSGEGEPEELKAKAAELSRISDELATAKRRYAARKEVMADAKGDALLELADQLAEFKAQAAELESSREAMAHEVESIRAKLATMDSPEKLHALILDPANNDIRLRLRAEIRRMINRIDVYFGLGGFFAVAKVKFINGVVGGIRFKDKQTAIAYDGDFPLDGEYDSSIAPDYDESEKLSDCSFVMDVPFDVWHIK